jgi:hypothetical protein
LTIRPAVDAPPRPERGYRRRFMVFAPA